MQLKPIIKNSFMAYNDKLVDWLNNLYAMEESIVEMLKRHKKDANGHPMVRLKIDEHINVTENQAKRLEAEIKRLGGRVSGVKAGIARVTGALQGVAAGMGDSELIKNAIAEYGTENYEAAAYLALATAAEAMGESRTAALARQIMAEEEMMAAWLRDKLPNLVREDIAQTEPIAAM